MRSRLAGLTAAGVLAVSTAATPGQPATPAAHGGRAVFERSCARCHGADGRGGEMGPGIASRVALKSDEELSALVRDGLPARGMPPAAVTDAELGALVAFARTLRPGREAAPARLRVRMADGTALDGVALNRTATDMQLLAADGGGLHLLRPAGGTWRRVTSQADWPTYHGDPRGNRYSPLDEIDRASVRRLAPAWVFPVAGASNLQVTPVVVDGVMYVTGANACDALDAGTGRRIWHYERPRTKGLAGDAAAGSTAASPWTARACSWSRTTPT